MKFWCVIVGFALTAKIDAANILAYISFPSISHQVPFRPLFQELARRGHNVTVITPDPAFPKGETPANLTEIDIHDVSYGPNVRKFQVMSQGVKKDALDQWQLVFESLLNIEDDQLNTIEVQSAIHGKKYDLILIEHVSRSALALSHVHKVPVIVLSSLGTFVNILEAVGVPTHPILYPSLLRQKLYNLTLWEKIHELYFHYKSVRMINNLQEKEHKVMRKHFGQDVPPLSELYNNIDMLFLNIHPIFKGNHPVPPAVIYMWGIHKKPQNELPEELKNFLDSSKHGVIYMSFGTNTDPTLLPAGRIQKFVNVFCQLPYDVLWKWNNDELPGRCKNIRIGKWFPQSDLLRHPNIKLFVTQGGLQSTDEAITAGVPLVGIPMLTDQWYNVQKYEHFKIGVELDIETLTEERFKNAVTTVIEDKSYRENIKKLDALMRDEPQPALERVVWWTEHVLRHGGARHLRAPAANISWAQYLELELVLTLVLSVLLAILLFITSVYYLDSFLRRKYLANVKLKSK